MYLLRKCFSFLVIAFSLSTVYAQEGGLTRLPLQDLSAFKQQAGNWQIVGNVTMDPNIDVHPPHVDAAPETGKKKKKSKTAPALEAPQAVTFESGKGILLNMNSEGKKDNLITSFEHGDIELEFEVMIPKGSNSGIYLQGRYEVQLLDSWGIKNPKFSDIGGIYRNWETEKDKIYMGKAPVSNPAKAAGLWQKMKISFRAPKFDASGKKIANARFVSVELNGVKIHDNVEVPLPTGGPIDNKEAATGPLMIQGDHGPVAFRNIQYKLMRDLQIKISPVAWKVYHGNFKLIADYAAQKPALTGTSPDLTCEVIDTDNAYAVTYSGSITVPEDNTYTFIVGFTGGLKLILNGETLIDRQRQDDGGEGVGSAKLKAGTYPFEIFNYKDASWMPPRLGLKVATTTSYPQTLNAFNSNPPDNEPTSPILLNAGSSPRLLRAFLDFKMDRSKRLTHTIGVADPVGINYVYDLEAGNLVCVWRGDFVDATPMWHDRGDGSFHPLGAVQYLSTDQPIAFLPSASSPFPPVGKEGEYKTSGYEIEESSGRPVFKYTYNGLQFTDRIYPSDENRSVTHDVTVKERGTMPGLQYKLAEGSSIVKMLNGNYAIDDKQYYIKVLSAGTPVIRDVAGKKELVVPFESAVSYMVIW